MKFSDASSVEIFTIPDEFFPESEDLNIYYKEYEHEKVNGGSVVITQAVASKYRNRFTFTGLPVSYVTQIMALKASHVSFYFQPFSDDTTEYLVNIINPQFKRANYWVPSTGERCWSGSFEVKEA